MALLKPGDNEILTGFNYLVRLAGSCTVGSWQSVLGAEPGRDQTLP